MKRFIYLTFLVLVFGIPQSSYTANLRQFKQFEADPWINFEFDGPYVFFKPDNKIHLLRVNRKGEISVAERSYYINKTKVEVVTHDGIYRFKVILSNKMEPATRYPQPRRIFAVSDLEGDFEKFILTLKAVKVIDDSLHWNWKNNHLIILGDVFGRGKDVVPLLWLIYRLEQEAEEMGGMVHLLLGDRESLALRGDLSMLNSKYGDLAKRLEFNYAELWGNESVLGSWLRTKNCMEVIGNDLYVHGGLSKAVVLSGLSFEQVNFEIKQLLGLTPDLRLVESNHAELLFGTLGPLLYRGLALSEKCHIPIKSNELYFLLRDLDLLRIVMGHSECDDVTCRHNGQVVIVNTNKRELTSPAQSIGLLISGDKSEIISVDGKKKPLIFNQ